MNQVNSKIFPYTVVLEKYYYIFLNFTSISLFVNATFQSWPEYFITVHGLHNGPFLSHKNAIFWYDFLQCG